MLTDEELFEEYLQQHCSGKTSKLDLSVINPYLLQTTLDAGYKLIHSVRLRYGMALPVPYIGFIDESKINACTFRYKDSDFIGINTGTLGALLDVFHRMMAHPDLFKLVGDSSQETAPEPYYDSIQDFSWIDPQHMVAPKDAIRKHHAHLLFVTALEFLIAHEYAHLIRGHVDLNNQYQGVTNWFEWEEKTTLGNKAMGGVLRQTLETDADLFAACMGFGVVLGRVNHFKDKNEPPPFLYASRENATYGWMFALYIIFRLLDHEPRATNFERLNYPPPVVRVLFIGASMGAGYKPKGYPEYYFAQGMLFAMHEGDIVLDRLFYQEAQKQLPTPDYVMAAQAHSDKLTQNWENVRPLLEPYTRIPLST